MTFCNVEGAGRPICDFTWFRFRYVDGKTGGYSKLSKWTASAVVSGSPSLPWHTNTAGKTGPVKPCDGDTQIKTEPTATCRSNYPILGTAGLDYKILEPQTDGKLIFANVHMFVTEDETPPPDDEEGEIIGILTPTAGQWGSDNSIDAVYIPSASPCENNHMCRGARCKYC